MKKTGYIFVVFLSMLLLIPDTVGTSGNNGKCKNEFVLFKDGRVRVAYKYDDHRDIWIDFKRVGINQIVGIESINLVENTAWQTDNNIDRDVPAYLKSCTDWIGPYIIRAENDVEGNPSFTSGWHGIRVKGSLRPTAKMIGFRVTSDGVPLEKNKLVSANRVDIAVINLVKAYNTKFTGPDGGYVLMETVDYSIRDGSVNIKVIGKALTDISIERYYGLQTQNSSWTKSVQYGNEKEIHDPIGDNDSGDIWTKQHISKFQLLSRDNNRITAWLDADYGIGKRMYVDKKLPEAFTRKYGKSYFNLINGKKLTLSKGEEFFWKGGYIFDSKNQ